MAAPPPYYAVASNQNNMSNNTDAPLSKVALNISCKNLANMDVLSKSDPQVFVFLVDAQQNETLIDKTEKIQNDLNPKFGKTILMDYRFEGNNNIVDTYLNIYLKSIPICFCCFYNILILFYFSVSFFKKNIYLNNRGSKFEVLCC